MKDSLTLEYKYPLLSLFDSFLFHTFCHNSKQITSYSTLISSIYQIPNALQFHSVTMSGQVIGRAYNYVTKKFMNIVLASRGPGWVRAVDIVPDTLKAEMANRVKQESESGKLFGPQQLGVIDEIEIQEVFHPSPEDPVEHITVNGNGNGEHVTRKHIARDPAKQK
ncbi:hypothetical protein TRV_00738 [Trichophyton verrucosum HKI 0517]|uniref:Uncharacterized protein n=1 Tax=Trichophyton verrucosum (strain HKI 0517) TaxID=663202 RepID=D4D0Z2_TRIVH|nr:uncharacterized protein TRV_00738 [Trichophyton verrucosum HKI 0517]EFE44469.1 hypothetical protein TRV_00738 [Trichophyton verrucosum HKI 0517]